MHAIHERAVVKMGKFGQGDQFQWTNVKAVALIYLASASKFASARKPNVGRFQANRLHHST